MSNAAISVKGLKKAFRDKEVLKGVDFEVQRGEIFALLGSNGAGKTTTVNILSTLLKQDSGEGSICGFDIKRQPTRSCSSKYQFDRTICSFRRHAYREGKLNHDC